MSPYVTHCCVPGCPVNWPAKFQPNNRRTCFAILRPDSARTEELRRHRQRLTDFILKKVNPGPDDPFSLMLEKEQCGICDLHFREEDMFLCGKKKRLRFFAKPLDEPRTSYKSTYEFTKTKAKKSKKIANTISIREDELVDVVNVESTVTEKQSLLSSKKKKTKNKIKCTRCSYATRNTDHMNHHVVNFHLQLKTYQCDQCDITACSKRLLEKHKSTAHSQLDVKTSSSRQRICKCGYKTSSFALFRRHFRFNHLPQFPWTCSLCSYVATSEIHLRQHVAQNHEESSAFICGICGYRADNRGVIKVHIMRKHLTFWNAKKKKSPKSVPSM